MIVKKILKSNQEEIFYLDYDSILFNFI
jgi:hypothetical protein